MKLCMLSLVCVCIGFAIQNRQWRSAEELEVNATHAWNQGDVEGAERIARRALARSSEAKRAREILRALAVPTGRPMLQLATVTEDLPASLTQRQQLIDAGRTALSWNLLRVADAYFERGVQLYPQDNSLQQQYVSISGLQLDAARMQRRLLQWAEFATPSPKLVIMLLGLSSIDSRAAATAEEWLRLGVAADSTDIRSRLGLGRCLITMGRFQECVQLLEPVSTDAAACILLSVAHASAGRPEVAARLIPSSEPLEFQAEYWHVKGLIAIDASDLPTAEAAFAKSVQHSPLNKSYRSRHCEILRRLNRLVQEQTQLQHLKTVIQIVQASSSANQSNRVTELQELRLMCSDVGAKVAAELIRKVIGE